MQTWIKCDVDIDHHPKILQMSWILEIDQFQAADLAMRWWRWARKAAPDGNVGKWTPQINEHGAHWKGAPGKFWEALHEIGYLEIDEDGIAWCKDWPEWGGASLVEKIRKNRAKYVKPHILFCLHYGLYPDECARLRSDAQHDAQIRGEEMRGDNSFKDANKSSSPPKGGAPRGCRPPRYAKGFLEKWFKRHKSEYPWTIHDSREMKDVFDALSGDQKKLDYVSDQYIFDRFYSEARHPVWGLRKSLTRYKTEREEKITRPTHTHTPGEPKIEIEETPSGKWKITQTKCTTCFMLIDNKVEPIGEITKPWEKNQNGGSDENGS